MINYDSPAELSALLREKGLSLKKRFGQNFLISKGAKEKIISLLGLAPGMDIWEIGPGLGAVTTLLLGEERRVTVFEIDHGFSRILTEEFGGNPFFRLVQGDAVKTWKEQYDPLKPPNRIVGNLPYSSGSAIVLSLLQGNCAAELCLFTLQKEVALRMTASPGDPLYSSFSLLCQSHWDLRRGGDLKPGSFYPAPEVVSAMVEAVPNNRLLPSRRRIFDLLARDLFQARRKTIKNNLKTGELARQYSPEQLKSLFSEAGINLESRGEDLSLDNCIDLTERIYLAGPYPDKT